LYRRDHLLVLAQTGARPLVGVDQAIAAEIATVRVVAIVAAESIERPSRHVRLQDGMVAPLPQVVSLQVRMAVHYRLVFAETSWPVAHRVSVLAQDARLRHRVFAEGIHHLHA